MGFPKKLRCVCTTATATYLKTRVVSGMTPSQNHISEPCRSGLTKLKEKQQTREAISSSQATFSPQENRLWILTGRGSSQEGGSICKVGRPIPKLCLTSLLHHEALHSFC